MTATTGYSSHRPLPDASERRTRTPIHTASASSSGGHTQPAAVSAPSPGAVPSSPAPVAPNATAGTHPHRCGWVVSREVSTASTAQPTAKPSSADPVIRPSDPLPNTTSVSTAASTRPVNSDPAMIGRRRPTPAGRRLLVAAVVAVGALVAIGGLLVGGRTSGVQPLREPVLRAVNAAGPRCRGAVRALTTAMR